ncbi:heat shock protein 30C-like [Gopherus flavomarginatus]|uniref:heat shock protein 30C-like n=1 Tax=Gopherus flavomarginatus TaxID=286002 RepID=UPI0021CBBBE5|nr:heat shock protein 30C-like [Gopherus flavomarginatus]
MPGPRRAPGRHCACAGPGAAGRSPRLWERVSVDVAGFSPEGLTVRMEGRSVTVTGKHAKQSTWEEGGRRQEYRELRTQAELPEDMDLQAVTCCLSRDGQLCIQALRPAPPPVEGRTLPISIQQAQEAGTGKVPQSSKGLGRGPAGGSEVTRAS